MRTLLPARPAATLALLCASAPPLAAQVFGNELVAPLDNEAGDHFGTAVTWTFVDEALVGAPDSDVGGVDAGRVLRLAKDGEACVGWSSCPIELLAPDGQLASAFGRSTALDRNTLLVGAPGTQLLDELGLPPSATGSLARGAAYVFTHGASGWQPQVELGQLVTSELLDRDYAFGEAVALDRDLAVVGGWSQVFDLQGGDGPVFVFERSGGAWSHAASLYPSGPVPPFGFFGRAVGLSGETIVVGAWGHSPASGFEDQGAAFVFERVAGVWTQTAALVSPDPGADHRFGTSVDVDGDVLVVGEPGAPAGAVAGAGRLHRWRRVAGTWTYDAELTAPGPLASEAVGRLVDLEGERILAAGSPTRIVELEGASALSIPLPAGIPFFGGGFDAAGDLLVVEGGAGPFAPTSAVVFQDLAGSGWTHVQTLHAQSASEIGYTYAETLTVVAGSPPRLVVSAPQGDGAGFASGLVELHDWSGTSWELDTELAPPDLTSGDRFGAAVARATFGLLAGAPGDDAAALDAGSVSSYGVTFEQRLLPPPPVAPGAAFGSALAADDDLLAVGEPGGDGRVHLYRRPGPAPWALEATVLPPEAAAGPGFGSAVAVRGGWLAVAAPEAATGDGPDRGAVYLFAEDGGAWSYAQKLEAPGGLEGERFGASLALSVDFFDPLALRLAAGAPAGPDGGVVHVFDTAGGAPWSWMDAVRGVGTQAGDEFGASVALDTYRLLVGAPAAATGGAAYQFSPCGEGWVQVQELRPSGAQPGDRFGESVAYLSDFLVGAPGRDGFGVDQGTAYLFHTQGILGTGGLTADVTLLSWFLGTPAHLALCAGLESAGKSFWILGSLSGTTPGFDAWGLHVPLNVDSLFLLTLTHPNQPPVVGSPGPLDDHGAANAVFQAPPGSSGPPFTAVDLAYLVIDFAAQTVDLASVAEQVVLN